MCVKAKFGSMKEELAPLSKRVGTCTMVLLDVFPWIRAEKSLLNCLDNLEPFLVIG